MVVSQKTGAPTLNNQSNSTIQEIPLAPIPEIKCSGYIYNPSTKKKTAMITLNGRAMTVNIHEKISDQIKVLDISDQKIALGG
ncbi:hypothetical protein [Niabella sp.]|uniref:hypothetical protein n=1 Tax=Niabella sp. TaxID=1962976 RepID=UPI00260E14A6|nr:hypothetical protein [Niabella sp.]